MAAFINLTAVGRASRAVESCGVISLLPKFRELRLTHGQHPQSKDDRHAFPFFADRT